MHYLIFSPKEILMLKKMPIKHKLHKNKGSLLAFEEPLTSMVPSKTVH